jgi:hypothetical protein
MLCFRLSALLGWIDRGIGRQRVLLDDLRLPLHQDAPGQNSSTTIEERLHNEYVALLGT